MYFATIIISAVVSIATSFLTFLGVEYWLKPWLRPKLQIKHDPASDFCRVLGKDGNGNEYVYLRLEVRNVRPAVAKSVNVYLMDMEMWNDGKQQFEPCGYHDVLALAWSYEGANPESRMPRPSGTLLYHGVPDYADVCYVHRTAKLGVLYNRYGDTFIFPGQTYRITLKAVAEDATPATAQFLMKWAGGHTDMTLTPGMG